MGKESLRKTASQSLSRVLDCASKSVKCRGCCGCNPARFIPFARWHFAKDSDDSSDQIRRQAHSSLKDIASYQQEVAEQSTLRTGRDRSRRRVSRTASAVVDGLTGLKPISTSGPSSSGEAHGTDKVSKLAKQLESLVSLAENNRRDEAREGVRMADDSHDAIAEGQSDAKGEERDYAVIEALRQEVMRAFEQEMSIRSLRSFENSQNTDPWW